MPDRPRLAVAVLRRRDGPERQPFATDDKQALMAAALAVAAPEVEPSIRRSRWGKPELPGNPAWVSLSHSGHWLAAAAARDRVGIDVQSERQTRFARIAQRLEWPASVDVGDAARFAALWTLWEAAIKAHRRQCRTLFATFAAHLEAGPPQRRHAAGWLLLYWMPDSNCHASVLLRTQQAVDVRWTGPRI